LNGNLKAGVDIILDTVHLDDFLSDADLVIVGEGSVDHSTIYNKAPVGVAEHAKRHNIPVVDISGSLGRGFHDVHEHGIDAATAITSRPMSLEEASSQAHELISDAAEEMMRFMLVGARVFADK